MIEWTAEFLNTTVGEFNVLEWVGIAALFLLFACSLFLFLGRFHLISFLASPGEALRDSRDNRKARPPPTGKEKVLLVDDEPAVLQANARLLSSLGYEVITANSGEQAIEYMQRNGADLLVLDLVMNEGIDGVAAFRRIREFRPMQKAIVVSGYAEPSKVSVVRNMGIRHYLVKPVALGVLAQALRDELDSP
jgi:CheY-like chemotaxis protein